MTALARIPLARVPARSLREDAAPKRLGEDQPKREFGDELAEETKKPDAQVAAPTAEQLTDVLVGKAARPAAPTAEQLALAGMLVGKVERPVAPIELVPEELGIAEAAQASSMLSLLPSVDTKGDSADAEEVTATPLEQAVIDILDKRDAAPEFAVVAKAEIARDVPTPRIAHAAPVAAPRELPQQDAPTSHVNLVLDEGEQRVVVTVAVRGNDVNVQLRGGDENVAASLARNAGSLDEAMRMRGLSLAEFTASREDKHDRERPQQERRNNQPQERFMLEETR